MKRILAVLVLVCLMFTGCGNVFDGHYSSVKPHQQPNAPTDTQSVSAADFSQLYGAVTALVEAGRTKGVIGVADYDSKRLEQDMNRAISEITRRNPIAAYAVEEIRYELGKSGGQTALSVEVSYIRNRSEILKIKQVDGVNAAVQLIHGALRQCDADLVLLIRNFEEMDFVQTVESYALDYPQHVIEKPQVAVNVYPKTGVNRVVELRFTYQTSRDSLRSMQEQVQPVFESAGLYVSGDAAEKEKYSQLYSFLIERYDYQIVSSITPAYSLLRHGVGDSRAFASVYAAMCRQAGLDCMVVSGTKNGESWHWNIICEKDIYYHVDLLEGKFRERTDQQMTGFVWDYSAYPPCGKA